MKKTIDEMLKEFTDVLTVTHRKGIENVLAELDKIGFFKAPASSMFHCDYEGGLLEHSLNVYHQMMRLRRVEFEMHPDIVGCVTNESTAIVALLHDVCKAEIYKKVEKFRKDKNNQWEKYLTWKADHTETPLGHGEKSVIRLLRWGLELTDDEILAIRWHMGKWDLSEYADAKQSFNAACDKTPLLPLLMAADQLASRISERPAALENAAK